MLRNMRVQDCMTHSVITVSPLTPLHEAEQTMKEYNIRHLPVVKSDKIVGILSSGDVRRARPSDVTSLSYWELNYLWGQITVGNAMSPGVITVRPYTPVLEAVRLMVEHRFNSVPVVDVSNHPVGILTEVDVFRVLLQESDEAFQSSESTDDFPVAALP